MARDVAVSINSDDFVFIRFPHFDAHITPCEALTLSKQLASLHSLLTKANVRNLEKHRAELVERIGVLGEELAKANDEIAKWGK